MKELSIEDKARRYDEAIEKFDVILNLNTVKESGTIFADDIRKIFPELKEESEDEKVRKWIIDTIKAVPNDSIEWETIDKSSVLAWLENQGEPNPYSGVSFKYNGHTWGMCARDNGVDILCDKLIIGHLEKQGEKPVEEYNITGISSKHAEGKLGEMIKNMESANKVEPKSMKDKSPEIKAVAKEFIDSNVESFANITNQMVELYIKKNHDYGDSFNENCDKIGVGYPLGRLLDKTNRLITCMGKEDKMQINESIEDTLMDLACYSVMTLSYLKRKNNK